VSRTYISAELRRQVRDRAGRRCEYCLVHEEDTIYRCEVDHIIAEKHGGSTNVDNLAYSCFFCNRSKGSDLGSLSSAGDLVRFFNPRIDDWPTHFQFDIDAAHILALTNIGEVTARIFGFNARERVEERKILQQLGVYPPPDV
jgi:hypothetical protein